MTTLHIATFSGSLRTPSFTPSGGQCRTTLLDGPRDLRSDLGGYPLSEPASSPRRK